jgi:hypothetical protein
MSVRRKAMLGMAATGVLAAVLTPTFAQADTPNIKVCNKSSTPGQVGFPERHGFRSTSINPGKCWDASLPGKGKEPIVFYSYRHGHMKPYVKSTFSHDGAVEYHM